MGRCPSILHLPPADRLLPGPLTPQRMPACSPPCSRHWQSLTQLGCGAVGLGRIQEAVDVVELVVPVQVNLALNSRPVQKLNFRGRELSPQVIGFSATKYPGKTAKTEISGGPSSNVNEPRPQRLERSQVWASNALSPPHLRDGQPADIVVSFKGTPCPFRPIMVQPKSSLQASSVALPVRCIEFDSASMS